MTYTDFKDYGIIRDTLINRKESKRTKMLDCEDCTKKCKVYETTSIISQDSILVSGHAPPIGFVEKKTWFSQPVCDGCSTKRLLKRVEDDFYD